jgi:hypothetical protein
MTPNVHEVVEGLVTTAASIVWQGRVISVQPCMQLLRSLDERATATWANDY